MYDLIIKCGTVYDGLGGEGEKLDIAVKSGKIAKIAARIDSPAKNIIDATALTVTPGFIDSHSHSDRNILSHPEMREKCEQGITTSIGGQCGSSIAPKLFSDDEREHSVAALHEAAKSIPQGSNNAFFVGHGTVRRSVMGLENRKPTETELSEMKQLVKESVRDGAMGVSYGLIYTPGNFADTEEVVELAKASAEAGGLIAAHIRNEGYLVIEAVDEFIGVAKASGARAVISHHKAAGVQNWGKVNTTLKMMDEANAAGADIYCDVYPYVASSTSLSARFVPKEFHADGKIIENLKNPDTRRKIKDINLKNPTSKKIDWVLVTRCAGHPEYSGKYVSEIAEMMGVEDIDAALTLVEISGNSCQACYFTMCEDDVMTVIRHPRAMICTDSGVANGDSPYHPRLRASFPRAIRRFVRELGVVSLPEMIRKMTSLPAAVYGLRNKGVIKEGYDADICVFDYENLSDRAEFTNPHLRADGLNYVIIGGEIVAKDSVYTGATPATVIKREV